jgi:hypothetical protein
VHPSVPVNSVPELIAYAKANPGKVTMGSSGVGTSPHLSGELFKLMTGVDMLHVPYRGNAPALTDLLAGQLQVLFDSISSSIEHIRSGKVRALAVTTATRVPSLPDVPTVGEFEGRVHGPRFTISLKRSTLILHLQAGRPITPSFEGKSSSLYGPKAAWALIPKQCSLSRTVKCVCSSESCPKIGDVYKWQPGCRRLA